MLDKLESSNNIPNRNTKNRILFKFSKQLKNIINKLKMFFENKILRIENNEDENIT